MPSPNLCEKKYGEKPGTQGFNDCISYTGKYKYKHGGNLNAGSKIPNKNFKGKNRRSAVDYSAGGKHYRGGGLSQGGMLVGPSHDNGGIQAIVDGTEPIEVEGGEFVINKQTVDAVGEGFLHKLNSTQTSYHTGGYGSGELPSPSNYADGGRVKRGGGRTRPSPARRMARGGRIHNKATLPGRTRPIKKMARGGGFSRSKPALFERGGITAGGRFTPKQSLPQPLCRKVGNDASTCKNTPGCTWDPSGPVCR